MSEISTSEGRLLFRALAERLGDPFGDKTPLVESIVRIETEAAKPHREVLEAIRASKTFGMLSHHLQDRVHGVLRR